MADVLRFAILGLGTGAIIASVGLGLVLTFRASGVVNFAQGAMAAWTVYTFVSLTDTGEIPLPPLPLVPSFIDVGSPWPVWAAFAASLGVTAVLSATTYLAVFRPLRQAPALARLAATLGVMIALQSAMVIRFGVQSRTVPALVPDHPVDWFGVRLGVDRYILLALVVALTLALGLLFARTRFGLSVRAAAEDERAASFMGVSADRLAVTSWVMASLIAGAVAMITTHITGLSPTSLTIMIVPALAAALVGGFRSFWITAATGLAIGVAQSLILLAEVRVDAWPDASLGTAVPFAVIAAAMLITGRSLPERGAVAAMELPAAYCPALDRRRVAGYLVLLSVVLVAVIWAPFEYRAGINASLIGVLFALSLVVVIGFAGQISLAQMVLAGVAAFAVATFGQERGLPFLVVVAIAVISATSAGLLLGLPSIRTRGPSLAVLTLAGGIAFEDLILQRDGWFGASGTRKVPTPSIAGFDFGTASSFPVGPTTLPSPAFGVALLFGVTIAGLGVMRLRRSPLGMQMLTVRSNERAAAAAGVDVAAVKLAAFGIAAALAGLGGALYAYNLGSFTARPFDVFASLTLLATAYLGGISTVGGAVWAGSLAAGGVFAVLQNSFYDAGRYTGYVAGIGLLITVVLYPEGIDGATRSSLTATARWLRRRLGRSRHVVATS